MGAYAACVTGLPAAAPSSSTCRKPTSHTGLLSKNNNHPFLLYRSAYFRLGHMLEQKVRCRCVLALTATATKATEADVTKVLKIDAANVVRDSKVRDNLRLSVTHFNGGML